ncbi:transcriptional regulator PocR [Vibrio mangrovi]|uniref:Arabinose operon regulatory protein n=1 Tax=Vibrio mangrovi TaxID=474394 RepID=A0A1Y6J2R8_9VIBR|nr:PocR ligand-binding domain-containing protein [Vibrio mangrovi]MDW6005187.1 PocR ligand-binding domain-containing protein [Vibrio mangrovi]SMS02603.1 Arabinose operon regulatory protein [Vibrio mangrovi]
MASMTALDSALIRKIASDFAQATGLAVVVVNIHGEEISERFNFSMFCKKIRENPELYHQCMLSDKRGGLRASADNKPCVYRCHTGLTDFSIPLIVEGHLVGFVLCGQVRLEQDEADSLEGISPIQQGWFKNEELRNFYEDVPVVDYQKVLASAELLQLIVDNCIRQHINLVVIDDTDMGTQKTFTSHSNDHKIKKALRFIEHHFSDDIKLEDVASHVYLSPYYFSKLFKKHLGVGFNAYLNNYRIMQAKKMLKSSGIPVATIAKNLGFSQTSYFCKVFRKICSMSPQEYREKNYQESINV